MIPKILGFFVKWYDVIIDGYLGVRVDLLGPGGERGGEFVCGRPVGYRSSCII